MPNDIDSHDSKVPFLSDTIFSEISIGNYDKYLTDIPTYQALLNYLRMEGSDPCKNSSSTFDFACLIHHAKPLTIHQQLNNLFPNKIIHIFNYLEKFMLKNENLIEAQDKINSLRFADDIFKVYRLEKNNISDVNHINNNLFRYIKNLVTLTGITEIETEDGSNLAILELIKLQSGFLQKLNKLNKNSTGNSEKNNNSYLIFQPLVYFSETLGELAFEFGLKEETQHHTYKIEETITTLNKTIFKQLNSDELSHVAWSYENFLHDGNKKEIAFGCLNLFGIETCQPKDSPETIALLEEIINQKNMSSTWFTKNHLELIIDYLLKGSNEIIKNRLGSSSQDNNLIKIKNFFVTCLQSNVSLDKNYLKKVFQLCSTIFEISTYEQLKLRNPTVIFDIKYFKDIQATIALVLNLVKSNKEEKELFDQIHIIEQLGNLVVNVLKDYDANKHSNKTNTYIINLPKSFLDIINYSKESNNTLLVAYTSFTNSTNKIAKICLETTTCNNKQILEQIFQLFGSMARRLKHGNKEGNISFAESQIIIAAKNLKNMIRKNINFTDQELGSFIEKFSKIHQSRNQELMEKDCQGSI